MTVKTMPDVVARPVWRPTRTNLVAGGMFVAGLLLTGASWWFLLLAAAGACGPGLLREMGLLRDKDEFQRRADYRAGYHAFLACGLTAFVLVAYFRSGERDVKDPQELATLFLVLLWFAWLFSSLHSYWGTQKAAARILLGFGFAWFVFAVVSNVGSEWTGWAALLLHPLLAAPFFALAWLSRRRPRIAGCLLLCTAVFLFQFLGMFRRDTFGFVNESVTFILFLGPLLASGIALLCDAKRDEYMLDP